MTVKWLSITLVLAVALSALLPFFAVHNPPSHLASVFGEHILICSGDGFKWVKLSDLQSGKEKPVPHSGDKCPLCYAARHEGKGIAVVWMPGVPDNVISAPPFISYDSTLVSLYRASPLNVRAPPVSLAG